LSDNYTVLPRWDRWFELHDLTRYEEQYPDYYTWMKSIPGKDKPLYVTELRPELPASVLFPYRQITDEFGVYFTNSVSWMTALALQEMAKLPDEKHAIHFYGVDMAQNTEYAEQRPSCEYFMGIAVGRGIEIYIPPESDILKCARLYAIESNRGIMDRKIRAREMELSQRQVKHESEREEAERVAYVSAGALQLLKEVCDMNGQLTPEWAKKKENELSRELNMANHVKGEALRKVYMLMGARENLAWSRQWA
jgi:hypothetical protein